MTDILPTASLWPVPPFLCVHPHAVKVGPSLRIAETITPTVEQYSKVSICGRPRNV